MERPAGSAFRRRSSPESSAGSQPEPTAAKTTSAKPGGADSRCLRQQLPPLNGLTSAFSATLRLQHDWCVPLADIDINAIGDERAPPTVSGIGGRALSRSDIDLLGDFNRVVDLHTDAPSSAPDFRMSSQRAMERRLPVRRKISTAFARRKERVAVAFVLDCDTPDLRGSFAPALRCQSRILRYRR